MNSKFARHVSSWTREDGRQDEISTMRLPVLSKPRNHEAFVRLGLVYMRTKFRTRRCTEPLSHAPGDLL